MFHSLSRLFSRPTRHRPRRGFRPGVEALEGREVPASLLDVTFQNGKLSIVGSSGHDTLYFQQQANGTVTLNTLDKGQIKLNGKMYDGMIGVSLNGPVTGGVTIDMGGGPDYVNL